MSWGVELRGVVVTILSLQFWNTLVSPTSKNSFMQLLVRSPRRHPVLGQEFGSIAITRITHAVEDITIRVTRPGGAGLRHNGHHAKPSTKLEDDGSIMGLRPGDGLRPVVTTVIMVELIV